MLLHPGFLLHKKKTSGFYIWEHIKQLVYTVDNLDGATLLRRILEVCKTIRHLLGKPMIRLVNECMHA